MNAKRILHYRILEKLGQGGMGEVYLAEDTRLGRQVAIKVLPDGVLFDDKERVRLVAEARAAASLNHPNIATIYAIEECEGKVYLVMEYVCGKELGRIIRSKHPPGAHSPPNNKEHGVMPFLPLQTLLDYAIQIANGLQFAHENHILHRDIKASNIMITDTGQVKIMDFGLARFRGPKPETDEPSTSGTLAYMAPEQIRGEDADHRADMWSFGVLLYEMLTATLPFYGDYDNVILYSIQMEEPAALANFRPELPAPWQKLIGRLLAKAPEARPQSMGDVLAEIGELKALHGEQTMRGKHTYAAQRITRPLIAWGITGMVMIAAIVTVVLSRSHFQSFIPERMLAVLPFENVTENPGQGFLAESFRSGLLDHFSHYDDIMLVNVDSSFQANAGSGDAASSIDGLKAMATLTSSIGIKNDSVFISVQLYKRGSKTTALQKNFADAVGNIIQLQEQIVRIIASDLNAAHRKNRTVETLPDVHPEALTLYLQGRRLEEYETAVAARKAVQLYQEALSYDTTYIPLLQRIRKCSRDESERAWASAKLALYDSTAFSKNWRQYISARRLFNWPQAEHHLRKCIELEPANALAHYRYSFMLRRVGRKAEAILEAEKAVQLDPDWLRGRLGLGRMYYYAGSYDRALSIYSKVLKSDPEFPQAYQYIVEAHCQSKNFKAASDNLALVQKYCQKHVYLFMQAYYHATQGQKQKALDLLAQYRDVILQDFPEVLLGLDVDMAKIYALVGENDKALSKLKDIARSSTRGRLRWLYLPINPVFDSLRQEPRFKAILHGMNIDA